MGGRGRPGMKCDKGCELDSNNVACKRHKQGSLSQMHF